jgi:hypothetical protein
MPFDRAAYLEVYVEGFDHKAPPARKRFQRRLPIRAG